MAWQEPYVEWANGNMFTYEDMNRIVGNINYLYPSAGLSTYTQNDILGVADWAAVLAALSDLIRTSGLSAVVPGDAMTADTMNDVENLLQDLYDRIGLNAAQAPATIYAGDDLYAASTGSYTDIAENYSRGV